MTHSNNNNKNSARNINAYPNTFMSFSSQVSKISLLFPNQYLAVPTFSTEVNFIISKITYRKAGLHYRSCIYSLFIQIFLQIMYIFTSYIIIILIIAYYVSGIVLSVGDVMSISI